MNILIVDDDKVDRESIRRALKFTSSSCIIQEVESVDEALAIIKEQHFDIILLDYNLPQRNGIELLLELQGDHTVNATAIIMMSSDEEDDLALECIRAGAQDFLLKTEISPFRIHRAIINARTRSDMEQQLFKSYTKTKELAEKDSLTGLANRYFFDETLKSDISNNLRTNETIALLLIDLDHFKFVNDNYGHDIGDRLLIDVVNRIQLCLRGSELFSRLGGDEFAITLTHLKSASDVSHIAKRIIAAFDDPFEIGDLSIKSSVSIGIALHPSDAKDARELFKYADIAMYRAKKQGRHQFSYFEAAMQKQFFSDFELETDLRKATATNDFTLHYQPILDGATKYIVGVEALIRWNNNGMMIGPDKFIPIAEKTLLILSIGRWVISEAIRQVAQWNENLNTPISMSINLSAVQLKDLALIDHIKACLSRYQVEPCLITFELTETALLIDSKQSTHNIENISNIGCKIALDDFGTGFSSLSHLIQYPLNIVKIDKSLMPGRSSEKKVEHILIGLVSMVKSLGHELVAEGIEQQCDLDLCSTLAIDKLQGYYFDKPLIASQLQEKYLS
jgi:diguanylate cyclase (GGDEF)-like protein